MRCWAGLGAGAALALLFVQCGGGGGAADDGDNGVPLPDRVDSVEGGLIDTKAPPAVDGAVAQLGCGYIHITGHSLGGAMAQLARFSTRSAKSSTLFSGKPPHRCMMQGWLLVLPAAASGGNANWSRGAKIPAGRRKSAQVGLQVALEQPGPF